MKPTVRIQSAILILAALALGLEACNPVPVPLARETVTLSAVVHPTPAEPIAEPLELTTTVLDETRSDPPTVLFRRVPELSGPPEVAAPFNALVREKVEKEQATFLDDLKNWTAFPDMPDAPHTFLSGFSVYSATEKLLSLKLEFSTYVVGAAHPYSYVRTVNFDLQNGRELPLKEIFKPGTDYLDFLSGFCKKELTGKLGDALFEEGLRPTDENFRSWGLTAGGLVVEFDPYQVAAYAAGPQQVLVPYENLKDLLAESGPDTWFKADSISVEAFEVHPQWPTPRPTP